MRVPSSLLPAILVASLASRTVLGQDAAVIDPHGDRAVYSPTALTQPAESFAISDYELVFPGVVFAPVDGIQLSLNVTVIPADDLVVPLLAAAKFRILNGGRVKVAVLAAALLLRKRYTFERTIVGGVAGSVCLDEPCESVLSLHAEIGSHAVTGSGDDGGGVAYAPVYAGASAILRVVPHVKLLAEGNLTARVACKAHCDNGLGDLILSAGLRFHGDALAVDVAISAVRSLEADSARYDWLPFLAATYRFR
jgi:hypothetical protein